MAESTIDIIATRILVESQEALRALHNFDQGVNETTTNLEKIAQKMLFVRRTTGRAIKEMVADFQKLNAPKGGGQFGSLGVNNKQIENAGKLVAIYEKQLGVQKKNTAESTKAAIAEERVAKAAEKAAQAEARKAALPKNAIPAFVQSQFGDIGTYIAQSQNKIEAWKRVVVASAKQAGVSFEAAGMELKKMVSGTTVAPLNTALKQLGDDGRSSLQKILDSANILRIALGAIVSMLLFQGIQAVTQFAKESVKQFTELEDSLFRIRAAEKVLSEGGVEISVAGMKKGISELRKELKIFSEEELTKLAGQLAISTKALGFNEQQILALTKAVAIKNKVSVDVESLDQTGGNIVTTLLTDQSKGAAKLGIELGDAAIKAKALDMHLLDAGQSASDLSEKDKKLVKLQIILDSAAGDAESFAAFLETNSAKLGENTASWEELQVAAGGFFATIIPALTKMFEGLTGAVNMFKSLVVFFDVGKTSVDHLVGAFINAKNPITAIKQLFDSFKDIPKIFNQIAEKEIPRLFAKIPDNAPDWFKNLFGRFLTDVETATGDVQDLTNIDGGETEDTLAKLDDQLRDIAIDAQQAREDLAVALSQKQEDLGVKFQEKTQDIDTEYQRKEVDAAVDLQRKISDIERDAERERQRVLDKARDDEQKAEEDHQLKLWELKMRYLMDLEDALHARDARQIIRLQRQYELDKELLEKKAQQESEERAKSVEDDLAAVEEKKQERLQDAQIEYEQKLADLAVAKARELEELNVWKAREQADLAVWYQRELDDIDRQMAQKIERLLAGYIEEGKLHEDQQAAIHEIFKKYLDKNKGLVDELTAYTANAFQNMANMAQGVLVQAGSLLAGLGAQIGSVATNPFGGALSYDQMVQNQNHASPSGRSGHAEGGTVLATKPTTALFGERGPELATFTPIGRTGRDMNKLFGDGSMGGGEGTINLDILLSPDLEARIVENSMDGVANVIARVNRSKV